MSEKIKVGIDNRGFFVYSDGDTYVGMENRYYEEFLKITGLSDYPKYSEKEIIRFGINKITNWKEIG